MKLTQQKKTAKELVQKIQRNESFESVAENHATSTITSLRQEVARLTSENKRLRSERNEVQAKLQQATGK